MLKSGVFFAFSDDQSSHTEEAVQSTNDVGIAKDNEDTMGNLAEMENDSSVQANDVEMEDDVADRNVRLPEDDAEQESVNGAQTNVDNVESTSMAFEKGNVDQEDFEMTNFETVGLDTVRDVAHKEDNVPEAGDTNTNETADENDLLESAKDFASNEDDADLTAAPLMEETPSSSHNDQAHYQEEPQETSDAPPTEQAPSENEPGEVQNADMETEQLSIEQT